MSGKVIFTLVCAWVSQLEDMKYIVSQSEEIYNIVVEFPAKCKKENPANQRRGIEYTKFLYDWIAIIQTITREGFSSVDLKPGYLYICTLYNKTVLHTDMKRTERTNKCD